MPTKELVARCTLCGVRMKAELTWSNSADPHDDVPGVDYRSPLVMLIGQHHRKFPKGTNHGRVVLFTSEEDAKKPPRKNISSEHELDLFPDAIGALVVARTASPAVNNVSGWFRNIIK
jgi:hypothetical protein